MSDRDLEVIARATGRGDSEELRRALTERPKAIESLLASPELFDRVFGSSEAELQAGITPFLIFGVLVHQTARDLTSTSFVPEWVGAGERLPVFDTKSLSEFIDDGERRLFLIEFLVSFTRIASGSVWVRTRRGYQRRRYSELDPVGLAEMVDYLPPGQRGAGYRRLGDVALFLTGVFPDYTARTPLSPLSRALLARSAGIEEAEWLEENLRFLEVIGRGWYDRAKNAHPGDPAPVGPVRDLAANFTPARRFLNYLADRYLHHFDTGLMNPVA